jgi:hypothetical protein
MRLATLPRSSATAFTVAALERVSWVAAPIRLTSLAVSTVRYDVVKLINDIAEQTPLADSNLSVSATW